MGHQEEVDNIENESKNKPWQSASSFSPEPGQNTALLKFLFQIYRYLFYPKNERNFKDNLSFKERQALINMNMWNKDPDDPRVNRVQEKGSRFVVDWKETYIRKSAEHIWGIIEHLHVISRPKCTKQPSGQGMGIEMGREGLSR